MSKLENTPWLNVLLLILFFASYHAKGGVDEGKRIIFSLVRFDNDQSKTIHKSVIKESRWNSSTKETLKNYIVNKYKTDNFSNYPVRADKCYYLYQEVLGSGEKKYGLMDYGRSIEHVTELSTEKQKHGYTILDVGCANDFGVTEPFFALDNLNGFINIEEAKAFYYDIAVFMLESETGIVFSDTEGALLIKQPILGVFSISCGAKSSRQTGSFNAVNITSPEEKITDYISELCTQKKHGSSAVSIVTEYLKNDFREERDKKIKACKKNNPANTASCFPKSSKTSNGVRG